MVAVFTGSGLGLFNTSITQLGGSSGGASGLGQLRGGQYVNAATGNLVLQDLDESLLVRGLNATFLRTYNSRGTVTGAGQDGFVTGFERSVALTGTLNQAGSTMVLSTGDGQSVVFAYSGTANLYVATGGDGAHDTLTWDNTARTWTYTEGSSRREELYADHASATLKGRLTRIRDLKSDGTTPAEFDVLYDANNRVSEVRSIDGSGATADAILFGYNGSTTQLTSVTTREGGQTRSQMTYAYDGYGRLVSVLTDLTPGNVSDNGWNATASENDGKLFKTTYAYVTASASDLRIASVTTSDGCTVAYTYESDGGTGYRVKTVTQGSATDGSSQTISFVYSANSTDVIEGPVGGGGRTWTYQYDANKQLTAVLEPAVNGLRQKTSYSYDTAGNLTRMSVAGDSANTGTTTQLDTVFFYDANGNRTLQRDRLGNTIAWTYDASNQVVTETRYTVADADGLDPGNAGATNVPSGALTTHYVYDARSRLRFVVDAVGAVRELTYATSGNGIGQVATERRYLGNTYAGTVWTESALNTWATDATAKPKSSSALTAYSYDAKGRLSQSVQYASVSTDVNGAGVFDATSSLTVFAYDAQGLLCKQVTVHGASRTVGGTPTSGSEVVDYVYDGMGRLQSVLKRDQATAGSDDAATVFTQYAYVDSANQVRVTLDSGVIRTEARNKAGQFISISESATVSGATVTRTTQNYYDANGRLRASQDATGARTYYFYDGDGRLTATVDGTGAVVQTVYDSVGRVAQTVAYATSMDTSAWLSGGAVVKDALVFAATAPTLATGQAWVPTDATLDRTTQRTYDASGRLATETVVGADSGQTLKTTYTYDGANRLLQVVVSDGAGTAATARTTRYLYDAADRQVAMVDAKQYVTEMVYDLAGRVVKTVRYANAASNPTASDLTTLKASIAASATNDQVTRAFYDGRGQQIGMLDAAGYLTEFIYDEAANQRAVKAYAKALTGLGGTETLSALRTLATTGAPTEAYRLTQRSFNGLGQVLNEVDAEGTVTAYLYDEAGRLVTTKVGNSASEIREGNLRYDVFGNLIGELGGEGSTHLISGMSEAQLDAVYAQYGVRHGYDLAGRRIESIDAQGNKTWYFYDADGRQTFVVRGQRDSGNVQNALGEVTETRYDAFGQVKDSIAYTGRITIPTPGDRSSLQGALSTFAVVSSLDSRVQNSYDRRGLLIQQIDADGYRSRYAYDAFAQLVSRQDYEADGTTVRRTASWTYDARGQVATTAESGGGLNRGTSTAYDAFGRAITLTDARSTATSLVYDRLGRVLSTSTTVGGRAETVSSTYDAFGRVLTRTDARGYATIYSYSDANRTLTITSAEGVAVTTAHNRFGQTVTVSQTLPGGVVATTTTAYDKNGNATSVTDPLGKITTSEYDTRGLLAATVDATGRRIEYTYDALGRVLTRREDPTGLNLVTTTVYDGQGRKIKVTDASGRSMTMAYDRRGNLTETVQDPTGLALRTTYTWDRDGQQLSVTEGAGSTVATTTAYVYDALGRRTQTIEGSGSLNLTTTYAYDANDNVVSKTDGSGRVTRYAYDAADRLRFTVDALGDVTEASYDVDGRLVMSRRYAKALNLATLPSYAESDLAAQIVSQGLANNALDETEYVIHDRDGRVAATIDGAGGVTTVTYDSAGRKRSERRYVATLALTQTQRNALRDGTATTADFTAFLADATNLATAETTRYVYDTAGRLRYTVDATGGVKGVWYDAAGRVAATRQLAKPISLALVNDNITQGQIEGALGPGAETDGVEYFIYDGAGRVRYTLRTKRAAADYPNIVDVTEVRYDGAGRLLFSRVFAASMSLDLTTAAKISGGNGEISDLSAFVSANGAIATSERRVYDTAGRLKHVIDAKGDVTETWYDAASRVVVTRRGAAPINTASLTDASTSAQVDGLVAWGANDDLRMYVYDGAGRQAYALQAVGSPLAAPFTASVTQARYDGAGRVLLSQTFVPLMSLDATLIGKLGAGTATTADFASFVAANQGAVQGERSVYDAAGRLKHTIDAQGNVSARWYDGAGRVVVTRRTVQPIATASLSDATTSAQVDGLLTWGASDDLRMYVFDAAGRTRFALQAVGSPLVFPFTARVSETRYDGAGRAVLSQIFVPLMTLDAALIDKLATGTATGTDFAAFVSTNAGSAQIQRSVHDAAGQLRYSIDALGYVTQIDRDGLGRTLSQQTYRNAITVTPALQAKLDAGTAVDADIASALGVSTAASWNTGFDSKQPLGLDVGQIDPLGNGAAVIQNGRLEFRRAAGSSLDYPQVLSQNTYSVSQAMTYRAEVSTDGTLTNDMLVLALNGYGAGGLQREGILIWDGQLYQHEYASGVDVGASTWLGSLDANTTYVVEIEVAAGTATTYVYAKGKGRDSGYRFSRALNQATFGDYRLLMHGTTEPGVSGGSVFVDNLAILNGSAVQSAAYRYDAAGQIVAKVDGLGNTETYTYDAAGRRLTTTDANGNVSRNVYDAAGRLIYAIDATGAFTHNWYDGNDRLVAVRRFCARFDTALLNDAVTVAGLDGQLDAMGAWSADYQAEYRVYDGAGRLRYVYDGGAYLTRMDYDGAGRMTLTSRYAVAFSPSDSTLIGRLFAGNATETDFSAFVAANEASARTEATIYDAAGRARYALRRDGSQWTVSERQYDGVDRVTSETQFGVTIAYTAGQTEAQVIGALQAQFSSDPAILLTQARTTRYLYDAAGQQRFVLDASFAVTEQRFDGAGQVIETRAYGVRPNSIGMDTGSVATWAATQAAADIRKVSMTYDVGGRLTSRTDALNHSETFTYDGADRMLTRTDRNSAVWTYQYDAAGRRVAEISPQVAVSSVDALGALSTTTRAIVTRYVYDALGQTTKKIEDADTAAARVTQYAYDGRGLLVKTTLPNAGRIVQTTGELAFDTQPATVETTYDALGQARVVKDENGKYRYLAYDRLGNLQAEVDQNGNVSAYYYNAYGDQTAMVRVAAALNTGANAFTSVNWQAGQAMSWAQVNAGVDVNATGNRWIATAYDGFGRKTQVLLSSVTYYKADGSTSSGQPQTTYTYNAYGEVVKQSVLLEGTAGQPGAVWADTWHYYDVTGRETLTIDAEGYATTTEYNATGDVTKVVEYARAVSTTGLGAQTPPALPAAGDATTGYDRETRWSYDLLGRKASETAVRHYRSVDGSSLVSNMVTTYGYDNEDRLATVSDATGTVTTSYDARGQVVAVQEQARSVLASNASTLLQQSTATNLSSTALYVQRSPYTTMAYDAFGNVVGVRRYANGKDGANAAVADDTRDQVATTRYLGTGLVAMTRDTLGNIAYSAYDAAGRLLQTWSRLEGSEDARDATVHRTYTYDNTGRQLSTKVLRTNLAGTTTLGVDQFETVTYNAFGEITTKVFGDATTQTQLAGTLQYTYDAAGRMTSDNATGATRNYGYNLAGQQVRESHMTWTDAATGAVEAVTVSQTDRLGRATSVLLPSYTTAAADTAYVRQKFDRWGNVTQVIDARGYQTDYQYDDRNQVVHETRPLVWVVGEDGSAGWDRPTNDWYYDALGRLSGTRDANGHLRAYAYDAAGRMVADTDALGNTTRHAYDALGNDVLTQDALDYITSRTYDKAGRVVATGDYIASGTARQANVLQTFVLDQNGDRIRVVDALGHIVRYDYDSQQRLIRSQTATGVTMDYAYDVQGRKVMERNAHFTSSNSVTFNDRDGQSVMTNGLTWKYDAYGRLTDHNDLAARDSDYVYDPASGMLKSESTSTGGAKTYEYTRNGRVSKITEAGGGVYLYAYDAAGNRVVEDVTTTDGQAQTYHLVTRTTYDSNNRIQRVVQDDVTNAKRVFDLRYDYDANGNRRRVISQSGFGDNVSAIAVEDAAPAVTAAPQDRGAKKGQTSTFRLLFSDVFRDAEGDALTLSITQSDGSALPSWLVATRDAQTGEIVFTATPGAGMADTDLVVKLTAFETANAAKTVSTTFTVKVRANNVPTTLAPGGVTYYPRTNQVYGRDLLAGDFFRDIDVNDALSLSVIGTLPPGLTATVSAGLVHLGGTPTTAGTYTFTLRATDQNGATADQTITLVCAANNAPTVVATPAQVDATIGRTFAWQMSLGDVFSDVDVDTLQVAASGLPNWVTFQYVTTQSPPVIRISGNVPFDAVDGQNYNVVLTATDSSGASVNTTLVVRVTTNHVPVAPTVGAKTVYQNSAYSLVLPSFLDEDADPLTYSVSNLPPGLSFNASTRTISGTPTTAGTWTVVYSAYDGRVTTTTSFTMTVNANHAPVAPTIATRNGTRNTQVYWEMPAFTDSDSDALTYTVSGLPTGLSFNAATRVVTGTPSASGSWTVTYTANDGRGGVVSTTFTYAIAEPVGNQAPVVTNPLPDRTYDMNTGFSFQFVSNTFSDPEGQTLTYLATKSDGTSLPSWLSFNPTTRTFYGTTPDIELTSWTIRVTATDPSGASVSDDFVISTTWQNGGGGQPQAMSTTFEMGMSEETLSQSATQSTTSSGPVAVQVKEQWFTYDALNRIKISGGVLVAGVPGQSNASIQVAADKYDSYELGYDAVGRLVATYRSYIYNTQSQIHVDWTGYDARGNRKYEFYRQLVGVSDPGVKSQYFYDADNQLVEVRTYMPNDTVKDGPLDAEGFPEYRVDVSGMLLTGQRMQYDADGRLLRQDTLERAETNWWYHPTWAEGAPAAQYNDLSVLALKERVDYTLDDGTASWNDTDPTNNTSGYDGAGRLVSYRYSAKQNNSFYTHTFTSLFTGWDSWQEESVTGASTNNNYKPTTNTLSYDLYGRLTQQREHTEYQNNAIDDRIRAYAYNAEGQVQARRDGTWHDNAFVQDTTITSSGAQEKQNYQFVFSAGQKMAELQAGGTVRVAESVDALAQYLSARGAELSPTLARQMTPTQNNRLSTVTGVAGSGVYTAGGGMVTVLQGETLQSLAQRVYGTSTLWYVLADANGLSDPNVTLTAGVQLKAPSASVNVNDANTFKPYNPSEATGPTSPSLPYIPPPPQAGCNALMMVLIVIIAVVVTIYTAGAATTAVAGSASAATATGAATATAAATGATATATAGLASVTATVSAAGVVTTSVGLSLAGSLVVGAAAGAAGALAAGVVGSLAGVSSFSWRNVAAGAITGAITGGITSVSGLKNIGAALEASKYGTASAMAVGYAGAGYVGQKLAGVDVSFSWKNIAAGAVANLVGAKVGNGNFKHDFTRDLAVGLSSGATGVAVRKAYGFNDIDYGAVAMEAAASAIGSAAGRKLLAAGSTSNVGLDEKTGENRKYGAGKIDLSKDSPLTGPTATASVFDNESETAVTAEGRRVRVSIGAIEDASAHSGRHWTVDTRLEAAQISDNKHEAAYGQRWRELVPQVTEANFENGTWYQATQAYHGRYPDEVDSGALLTREDINRGQQALEAQLAAENAQFEAAYRDKMGREGKFLVKTFLRDPLLFGGAGAIAPRLMAAYGLYQGFDQIQQGNVKTGATITVLSALGVRYSPTISSEAASLATSFQSVRNAAPVLSRYAGMGQAGASGVLMTAEGATLAGPARMAGMRALETEGWGIMVGQAGTADDIAVSGAPLLREVYGSLRTIYNGPAAQASQPYRINAGGGYSAGALKYTDQAGVVTQVRGWSLGAKAANSGSATISNKFPLEALNPNGRIFGVAQVVDGRITLGAGRQIPRDVDFVITQEGKLVLGRKHTTLANGQDVLAAGRLKLTGDGRVRLINNLSGHYQPTVSEASAYPAMFQRLGVDVSEARLQLWDILDAGGYVNTPLKPAVNRVIK